MSHVHGHKEGVNLFVSPPTRLVANNTHPSHNDLVVTLGNLALIACVPREPFRPDINMSVLLQRSFLIVHRLVLGGHHGLRRDLYLRVGHGRLFTEWRGLSVPEGWWFEVYVPDCELMHRVYVGECMELSDRSGPVVGGQHGAHVNLFLGQGRFVGRQKVSKAVYNHSPDRKCSWSPIGR